MNWDIINDFDKKAEKGVLTYEDNRDLSLAVFGDSGFNINKRFQKNLEKTLKHALHSLKSSDSEASHKICHDLLGCMSPFLPIDEEQYNDYKGKYKKILKKHNKHCHFKSNYDAGI